MRVSTRAVAALAVSFGIGATANAQQFTMKISSPTTNDITTEWMRVMKAGVEGRSGGRIKVEGYPANQLGQLPRAVEGVALGTIEVTISAIGFFVGLEPRFEALEVPGLFDDQRHALRVLADPEVRKRLATFGDTKGIEPLWMSVQAPIALVSHKPVRTLADLKGQKLRTPGPTPIHMDPLRRLGAAPLGMALGEALPAMQNRTIDGAIATINVFNIFKYYDVAKSVTTMPQAFLVFAGAVNRAWMKSLGPELEAIVRDEAAKADALGMTFGLADVERATKSWEANGGQMLTLPAADAARFIEEVRVAVAPILAKQPRVKEDHDALLAAAKRLRQ
ncbi:MAG: TRAP transporter substrate-binding protein [Burkholderiales bacterium]